MRALLFLFMSLLVAAAHAGGTSPAANRSANDSALSQPGHSGGHPTAVHTAASQQSTDTAPPLRASDKVLAPYQAVYSASYNRIPIEAKHSLRTTDTGFNIATEASNFLGKIREQESFHLGPQGQLIPDHYEYSRSILGKSRKETLAVDAAAGVAQSHYKSDTTTLDFKPGQLGPLSYQIAMAHDLAHGAKMLRYTVMQRGRLREYTYQVVGKAILDTPLGSLDTLKVERVRDDDERETVLWLAPELNYLIVRLKQVEGGETYEMTLKSFTLKP